MDCYSGILLYHWQYYYNIKWPLETEPCPFVAHLSHSRCHHGTNTTLFVYILYSKQLVLPSKEAIQSLSVWEFYFSLCQVMKDKKDGVMWMLKTRVVVMNAILWMRFYLFIHIHVSSSNGHTPFTDETIQPQKTKKRELYRKIYVYKWGKKLHFN